MNPDPNLQCRILNSDDMSFIKETVSWHNTKYGYEINKDAALDELSRHLYEKTNIKLIGCFENNNILGICSYALWTLSPFWTLGRLAVKPPETGQGSMTTYQLSTARVMIEYCCTLGETENRYDWFSVANDSSRSVKPRDEILLKNVYARYNVNNLYTYEPGKICPWPMFNTIFDTTKNSFKRPLTLRMYSLKNELRPF